MDRGFEVLFVCTGNICRSPMAEALTRLQVARELEVSEAELAAAGVKFSSAGTAAWPGNRATTETRAIWHEPAPSAACSIMPHGALHRS